MNTRDFSFYAILGGAEGIQEIIDTVNEKYNNTNWKGHFSWGIPQISLTFQVLSATSNIAPMASIIDINSPKPLRSVQGFKAYGGAIPKLGHGFDIEEQTMRDQQIIAAHGGSINRDVIAELLFNNADTLIQGAHNRLNFMDDQVRSTGKLLINVDNNADGIIVDVDYRVPVENFLKAGFGQTTTKRAWSDPDANPIQDLIDMVRFADDNNIAYAVLEMSKTLWNQFTTHPNVLAWVKSRMKVSDNVSNYPISLNEVREALTGFDIPPIIVNDSRFNMEVDGIGTTVKAFNEGNVVLRPSGIMGKMANAISMHTLAPSTPTDNRSTVEGNRIAILNQWESRKLINHIELEGYAVPTLSNPKNLVILDTTEAAS